MDGRWQFEEIQQATKTLLTMTLVFVLISARGALGQTSGTDQEIDEVDVVQVQATVDQVDLEKRKITLRFDDGKKKTFKVDKRVQNFDQVKVGDHLKATYTEELVVTFGKSNEALGSSSTSAVKLAPKGAKPGIVEADVNTLSGKILAVDAQKRRVMIEEPDGKKKTLRVSKKVNDLDRLKPGETFDMALTDSVAIEIVK
ncbi:MAG TPA: hypothetical protein VEI01_02245 [Terriglobales bacterium]|nr:hypothetical protein [Terriglobales bacterium]